ncbi:MAG: PilZ domain-containing protein [Candidatus Omnitrophota bacterium]
MNWDSKERRKFVRIKCPCEIVIPGPKKHILPTYIENISAGGIRFIIEEKIKLSSTVELNLYGIDQNPIICKGRVRWVFTKKDPCIQSRFLYDTGIEFSQIKKEDLDAIKNLVVEISSS